jgi:hypothetical protein
MKFEFSVGTSEKHQVQFQYSRISNTVRICVDGDLVEKDAYRIWIPASRKYDFEVGEAEQHDVSIETDIPRVGAKFRNPACSVMIDGKFVHEY